MKKLVFLSVLVFFGFTSNSSAQTDVNKDVDVTQVYEQVVKEGYGTPLVYKDLANAYYFKSDYTSAKKYYEMLFEEEFPKDATLRFRYKQSLKALDLFDQNNKFLVATNRNTGTN